ncbi:cell division protein FtsL [Vreelandella subglaciescola]|jgi:cell division protein FtsL|uniref:Cell division protein FtsL n=1 Tax=Vreelandella subglaciescola TaxID=29571 RepID=A0A1M7F2H9_9GAMM|nr:cell division protein FtsL [Halomonas subglaciescola]SHL98203.1 cell division protein FtsL [Halomonas subglaciescola]
MAGHATRTKDKKRLRQWVASAERPRSLRVFLRPWPLLIGALMLLCLLTGLAIVAMTHQTRVQYAELQTLEQENNQLNTEWGQLLLEDGTWSTPARIEKIATERLSMRIPDVHDVKVIQP